MDFCLLLDSADFKKKKKCKKWVYYMKKYSYLKTFVFIFLWLI